ncbi:ribosomal RNA large subunit methyltransferase J [Agaricicola taiwanensis]|uniref:Ribosomal RNA large subunit methyltransferase J n=1 Tax=Agaricicola taiwanensis TaxID=591372 RepID=A0A8J2YDL2_9RHOB|nr:23S rRNA (adenine(2030)-N(6))-methyltransferase RlmJ [Agaricicola taiwanensis]GGE40369.1 ribosomal RNA large subunit methyltransferase J [Agaricicola taiwanensis]
MNYRHAFHAGNFADVFKHAIFARSLTYLNQKNNAYRVIDTHAGVGIYDLRQDEASRTEEWREGIGRLWQQALPAPLVEFLKPYLDTVAALNPSGDLRLYPGSPELARRLSRPQDRLALCELHPQDNMALRRAMGRDPRVTTLGIDGWVALNAQVPPKERRGLVLIDPPFEKPGEFDRLSASIQQAHAKWPTGTYCAWYPGKHLSEIENFARTMRRLALPATLRMELWIRDPRDQQRLNGNGIIMINPPWTLARDLELVLPALVELLAQGEGACGAIEWIVPQT